MNVGGIAKGITKIMRTRQFKFVLSMIGIGVTTTTAITGTIMAVEHVKEAKEDKLRSLPEEERPEYPADIKLTAGETFAAVWKDYIPMGVSAGLTIFDIVNLYKGLSKEIIALNGVVGGYEATVQHLQDKVVEKLGEKKGHEAIVEAQNEAYSEKPPVETLTKKGFLDDISDEDIIRVCVRLDHREFKTTKVLLTKAISVVNSNRDKFGEATLNDFYEVLGQPESDVGGTFKWLKDSMNDYDIDIQWNFEWSGAYTDANGQSWTYIDFTEDPKYEIDY